MSSITRAFTKRSKRPEVSAPMPFRQGSTKMSSGSIKRGKISGPVELLSTTNMLAYNAPDLPSGAHSSSSSMQSRDDSDWSSQPSYSSPLTSPDESSDDSPVDPLHPNSYFPKRSVTVTTPPRSSGSTTTSTDAPAIPRRALSHTKRSHQELARQNSLRRGPPSRPQTPLDNEVHPFDSELKKVNEVVEEFGGLQALQDEEMVLHHKGLKKFSADDYLMEIEELYGSIFDDQMGVFTSMAWL